LQLRYQALVYDYLTTLFPFLITISYTTRIGFVDLASDGVRLNSRRVSCLRKVTPSTTK
jgi:hypothetical protein